MALRDMGPWQYETNNGRIYVRRADKFLTAQEGTPGTPNVGGSSAAGLAAANYEPMPTNYRPRQVKMGAAGQPSRYVVVYNVDAPLWGVTPPTMSLKDANGVAATYTVEKKIDERLGRIIGRGE
jgi:hypothetical protein